MGTAFTPLMRFAKKSTGTGAGELPADNGEVGAALLHALDLPLNALRASMEALLAELEGKAAGRTLPHVLNEVRLLERNVRDLIAFTTPSTPSPLRCTLDEITQSAREELPSSLRGRVVQARHDHGARLFVDGPMVSRCLRRLIENALEAGSQNVLLISKRDREGASFTVVDTAPEFLEADWALQAFRSKRSNHLGLGLPLVQRDVSIMGGDLTMTVTPFGSTCIEVRVPEVSGVRG